VCAILLWRWRYNDGSRPSIFAVRLRYLFFHPAFLGRSLLYVTSRTYRRSGGAPLREEVAAASPPSLVRRPERIYIHREPVHNRYIIYAYDVYTSREICIQCERYSLQCRYCIRSAAARKYTRTPMHTERSLYRVVRACRNAIAIECIRFAFRRQTCTRPLCTRERAHTSCHDIIMCV